jgi:hypothetical protein
MRPTTSGKNAPWKQDESLINLGSHEIRSEEHIQEVTDKG